MEKSNNITKSRRTLLKTTALGILGLSLPGYVIASNECIKSFGNWPSDKIPKHFPNIDPEIVSEVVGKSHSNLEGVKKLVDKRPELARSVWEWRFGDFESAIGAASHVGRRDIVEYLMGKGARPTIFTFAMMGAYETVKSMVEFAPGIQKTMGPHGISLLNHAYYGERMKDKMSKEEIDNLKKTIAYLESLGDASDEKYMEEAKDEQSKFLGNYKYGDGEKDGFTIALDMREKMALGPIGGFGGALYKIKDNLYTYNGAPSINVTFDIDMDNVRSLTLTDPTIVITARKI